MNRVIKFRVWDKVEEYFLSPRDFFFDSNGKLFVLWASNINNKETNLQIHKLHDECKSLFWLFNTCCNKPETLDVYTFLV